jgi:hypothetical protein
MAVEFAQIEMTSASSKTFSGRITKVPKETFNGCLSIRQRCLILKNTLGLQPCFTT